MGRSLPAVVLVAGLLLVVGTWGAASAHGHHRGPVLLGLNVTNGDSRFAGDRRLLTTISPNRDGFRDRAVIHFRLPEVASVRLTISRTRARAEPIFVRRYHLGPGKHALYWRPPPAREPRSYLTRLVAVDRAGDVRRYGATDASSPQTSPVIHVQGVDAAFRTESYRPGRFASLGVETDATGLELQLFRSGTEYVPTRAANVMEGTPVTEPVSIDWRWRSRRHFLRVFIPGRLDSGLYFARLTASDGRVGFAPFVLRPRWIGTAPVAVVLPTSTWQAYNFRDADGDGWGDTWYSGPKPHPATLRVYQGRPFLNRGVPPHFRNYDLDFLRWLVWRHHEVDYFADTDLGRFLSAKQLRRLYELIVFPGHTEYVTTHAFRVVRRYRDLGGHLIFLSANNFYWRVLKRGRTLVRARRWRDLGRPEAAFIGVQYEANNGRKRLRPYVVRRAGAASWLFEGTGLRNGSRFGYFGIEIDGRAPSSPPRTHVLADIRHMFGRNSAQMTYYETRRGAKVFAFGAFSLAGVATQLPYRTMLDNLWARLAPATSLPRRPWTPLPARRTHRSNGRSSSSVAGRTNVQLWRTTGVSVFRLFPVASGANVRPACVKAACKRWAHLGTDTPANRGFLWRRGSTGVCTARARSVVRAPSVRQNAAFETPLAPEQRLRRTGAPDAHGCCHGGGAPIFDGVQRGALVRSAPRWPYPLGDTLVL